MKMDPYRVLGVKQDATPQDIKKAYKHLAMKLHPDKIGDNLKALEQMKLVNEAYAILKNKGIRESFDEAEDWGKEASIEDREKVWVEYSKQVEQYYGQVRGYLEKKLGEMQTEREKLSKIEAELRKREAELVTREKAIDKQVAMINQFGGREKELQRREQSLASKEKQLKELFSNINKAYSLSVDIEKSTKEQGMKDQEPDQTQ
ncbi:MAG: DnaJ domain-containing protein [Candidatus Thermoplasmatota archaeon]|nr:DnaJ domain-containing protein [Candidatus Thermoplasmatota archaeon]